MIAVFYMLLYGGCHYFAIFEFDLLWFIFVYHFWCTLHTILAIAVIILGIGIPCLNHSFIAYIVRGVLGVHAVAQVRRQAGHPVPAQALPRPVPRAELRRAA